MERNIPQKIQTLIDTLNAKERWKTNELQQLLEELNITESDVVSFQRFNHEKEFSYGRNKIYANKKFRVYLMSWDYGDATAIHDHGSTDWGAVQFFGDMEHRCYEHENEQLKMVQKEFISQGEIVSVKGSLIHMMANCQKESMCTLHIYGVNTGNCEEDTAIIFQPEKQRMLETSGTAFLNMDEGKVLLNNVPALSKEDYQDYLTLISPFYNR